MEEVIEYKDYKIKIINDENSSSPDENDDQNLFLVYNCKNFRITKSGFDPFYISDNLSEFSRYWIFPVNAYIHSGTSLSLTETSDEGFILASKDEFETIDEAERSAEYLIEEWNNYLSGNVWGFIIEKPEVDYIISKDDLETVINKAYQYINLDEFMKVAKEHHNWTQLDSCWGFSGDPEESGCISEAKLTIDNLIARS